MPNFQRRTAYRLPPVELPLQQCCQSDANQSVHDAVGYNDRDRRVIWVDALRGPVPSYTARQQATRPQAVALGFAQAVAELPVAGRA